MSVNRIPMQRHIVSSLAKRSSKSAICKSNTRFFASSQDPSSNSTKAETTKSPSSSGSQSAQHKETLTEHRKTLAELDKELELKMRGIAGDGGDSGVEYEDGQPVAMKRSVKDNMFRYI